MKNLSLGIAAGLLAMAFASAAFAYSGHEGWYSNSIDPSGYAQVSIEKASNFDMTAASSDVIYLDSNHLWAVRDLKPSMAEGFATHKINSERLYCFDSISRFCAISR